MVAPCRPMRRPRSSPLMSALTASPTSLAPTCASMPMSSTVVCTNSRSTSASGGRVVGDALVGRPQARLDPGFALAAPEEAALAAFFDDDEVDVGLVDVGDDLAKLVQRLALGLLDGGRTGDGRELRVVVFAVVDRLKVVRLCHRCLRSPRE